jgi:hypothetical protein
MNGIKVVWEASMDGLREEINNFPKILPCRPMVGDLVQSSLRRRYPDINAAFPRYDRVEAKISSVKFIWRMNHETNREEAVVECYLTHPDTYKSIADYYERFLQPLTGRRFM